MCRKEGFFKKDEAGFPEESVNLNKKYIKRKDWREFFLFCSAPDGYVYVVDMDLEKFFDTACQSKLIEVLPRTIKDGRVIPLIHKYPNVEVIVYGMFERTEIGSCRAVCWKQWKKVRKKY